MGSILRQIQGFLLTFGGRKFDDRMKEEYSYEEILGLSDLDDFQQDQVCNILAIIFETGREEQDAEAVRKGLELAEKQRIEDFNDYWKSTFFYFVSNGWFYLQQLTQQINSTEFWVYETQNFENQIINLRKALLLSEKSDSPALKAQILTNLGNTFSQIGRFIEATQYWHQSMEEQPGFGMAVGSLGFGLEHYARVLFDEGHQFLFCQFAYKYLLQACDSNDVYKEGQETFRNLATTIEERFDSESLEKIQDLKDFSLGKSEKERNYRQWCIEHRLFINPLNDFLIENIVGHDCLFLPTMTLPRDYPPVYHTLYNQLKQEYVSARYLYYESLNTSKVHFSDKDNKQMDTLDYAVYSLNTEKLKIVFRVCYSLFDKTGYLLNSYFGIGMNPKDVSFRKIWHIKSPNNKWELNPIIAECQNWPLRGLYWLSKDLVELDTEFSKAILPEAKQIATIRNFIEHKSFKIVEIGETMLSDDDLTFQITRYEFEQKVFILMQMARSAIMYLSFAIHVEEQKKEKRPSLPVPFFELREDYKT